jgi:hypothetical protein
MAGSDRPQHIPFDRMRLVVVRCDQFLTEAEEEHLGKCADCLRAFSQAVLSKWENGYNEDNEKND